MTQQTKDVTKQIGQYLSATETYSVTLLFLFQKFISPSTQCHLKTRNSAWNFSTIILEVLNLLLFLNQECPLGIMLEWIFKNTTFLAHHECIHTHVYVQYIYTITFARYEFCQNYHFTILIFIAKTSLSQYIVLLFCLIKRK